MADTESIGRAYDGSTLMFRALSAFGWGPLLNLGYFSLPSLPLLLLGLAPFQRALARRSISLLRPAPGELIADVGCGQGWSTREIARRGARAIGIDLVEAHTVAARGLYADVPELRYQRGDAARLGETLAELGVAKASLDGVLALECAFQFGREGRRAFLAEAHRALRPGGRLVIVDFAWRRDDPYEIERLDPDHRVRGTWAFEVFEPLSSYREAAREAGFEEEQLLDWSGPVLNRFQLIGDTLLSLGRFAAFRFLVSLVHPGLRAFSAEEWAENRRMVQVMSAVRASTCYVAMRLVKPVLA